MLFGLHFSSGIDLRPSNMAVHVNSASHDNATGNINRSMRNRFTRWINNLPFVDPNIPYLTGHL
jgi:hypothetical protein